MKNNKTFIKKFKICFFYSIDIGYFLTENSVKILQKLRASENIKNEITDKRVPDDFFFENPRTEATSIRERIKEYIAKKGKIILGDVFIRKFSPIIFNEKVDKFLTHEFKLYKNNDIKTSEFKNISDTKHNLLAKYDNCELRLFKDGIISIRFEFSSSEESNLSTESFSKLISKLKEQTKIGFFNRMKSCCNGIKTKIKTYSNLDFKSDDRITDELLEEGHKFHDLIFIDSLYGVGKTKAATTEPEKSENFRHLLRILNRSDWYLQYSKKYLEMMKNKNIGYREDEIYITDHASTLIMLAGYFEPENALIFYKDDLALLTEYILSRAAILEFLGHIFQEDYNPPFYSKEKISKRHVMDEVENIVDISSILLSLNESIQLNTLTKHGFTRKFSSQIMDERSILSRIDMIKNYADTRSNAVKLISQHTLDTNNIEIGLKNFLESKKVVFVALVSLWVIAISAFLEIIDFFTQKEHIEFIINIFKSHPAAPK